MRQFWRDLLAVFRDLHLELEELIEVDAGVRAAVHEHNVGRISGVAVDRRHFAVRAGHDGNVVRVRIFDERSEAERAGGVRK